MNTIDNLLGMIRTEATEMTEEYPPLNIKSSLTLNVTSEDLGREVRRVWVECAEEDPNSPPHHLIDWEGLDERNKEIDRRIGESVAKLVITNLSDDSPTSSQQRERERLREALAKLVDLLSLRAGSKEAKLKREADIQEAWEVAVKVLALETEGE